MVYQGTTSTCTHIAENCTYFMYVMVYNYTTANHLLLKGSKTPATYILTFWFPEDQSLLSNMTISGRCSLSF